MTEAALSTIGHNQGPLVPEFEEFDLLLVDLGEAYADIIYDLDDPKQEKQARSDRLKLGKAISKLDSSHKRLKEPMLEQTRVLDGERKRIKDGLIAVQDNVKTQIAERERVEGVRTMALHRRIAEILALALDIDAISSSAVYEGRLQLAKGVEIDDSWQELKADAALAKMETIAGLEICLEASLVEEAKTAELERLRQEEAARLQQEREEAIARDAVVEAKREAEAQAVLAKEAADKRLAEEQQRSLDAELAKAAAIEQREEDARAAEERALLRVEAERRQGIERQAEERRQAKQAESRAAAILEREKADKSHRKNIHAEARDSLMEFVSAERSTEIITAIKNGKVKHVRLEY